MAENHSLRWRRMLLSIALLLLLLHPQLARAQAVSEYQVKAAFLYNFAKFVDWPAGALNATDQIISLCVFDDEPRLQELLSFLEDK